jgi:hypothetical protein
MSEKDNFKLEKEKAVKNLQVFTWENFEDKNVLLPMFAADAADDVYKNINYPKSVPIVSVIPKKKQMKTNATEGSQAKKVAEPVKKTTKKPDEATKPDGTQQCRTVSNSSFGKMSCARIIQKCFGRDRRCGTGQLSDQLAVLFVSIVDTFHRVRPECSAMRSTVVF